MFATVLLIGLILYQIIGSLQSNDCALLSVICRKDPQCGDETVFYSNCVERFGKDIPAQDISDAPVTWADRDNPERPLYIDKRKLDYANIYNNYINTGSTAESQLKDYIRNTRTQNLKDLYADYQRESIRESLYLIKKKLHDQKTNTNANEETVDTGVNQNSADTNTNSNDNGELSEKTYSENTPKKDVRASQDTIAASAVGKQDVINKAFKLVQTLISQHDSQEDSDILLPIDSEKHSSDAKRKVFSEEEASQHSIAQDEETQRSHHVKADEKSVEILQGEESHDRSDTKVHEKSVEIAQGKETNEKSHANVREKSVDHVEIGVPIYTRDEDDFDGGTVTDVILDNNDDGKSLGEDRGLLTVNTSAGLSEGEAVKIAEVLSFLLWNISLHKVFHLQTVRDASATYQMNVGTSWFKFEDNAATVAKRINTDEDLQKQLNKRTGVSVVGAISNAHNGYSSNTGVKKVHKGWDKLSLFSAIIAASVLGLLFGAIVVCAVKRKGKSLTPLIFRRQEAVQDYQELCRTQMSVVNSPHPEDEPDKTAAMKTWNDDQSPYNMDITTGHVILAYMEDHLKNENRLNKEWEALCNYKADESETLAGSDIKNITKNRYRDVLPYEHTRVKLREAGNAFHSDYINASFITDTDPRNPTYIATQGPLDNTVADFWQMVWEQGVVVIINLTKLSDMGLPQCHHYWPLDGCQVYHIFEVHLISEHIWCDDYLVRSLYLKNLQTAETRTVTQFHYLTWPDLSIPSSPKPLLEFRRKVNKCYRGHACPVIVHCNNGVGRTGTYILLDMVLNKMIKGTKEIDIAATLEHLRDQRQDFVKTKGQFEFALLSVAEEVTAILSAVTR